LDDLIVVGFFVSEHPDITDEATQIGIFPLAKEFSARARFILFILETQCHSRGIIEDCLIICVNAVMKNSPVLNI